jgi:hypothetical protein
MGRFLIVALALSLFSGVSTAAQQVYVWTDEYGNREYRDTPPPPGARNVERRKVGISTIQTSELPYSVRQAVKNFPVTLWVFSCGGVCDNARAHLLRRGVPHTEKNPQAEREAFEKLTGGVEVPVLYVGTSLLKGYLASEWDAALDVAGYPRTPPLGFKPPARPAPVEKPAAAPAKDAPEAGGSQQAAGQPAGK